MVAMALTGVTTFKMFVLLLSRLPVPVHSIVSESSDWFKCWLIWPIEFDVAFVTLLVVYYHSGVDYHIYIYSQRGIRIEYEPKNRRLWTTVKRWSTYDFVILCCVLWVCVAFTVILPMFRLWQWISVSFYMNCFTWKFFTEITVTVTVYHIPWRIIFPIDWRINRMTMSCRSVEQSENESLRENCHSSEWFFHTNFGCILANESRLCVQTALETRFN